MVGLSLFFFTRLDNIVHGDLYSYGLQFSNEWAMQYWTAAKLMLGFLGVAVLVTCVSIAFTLLQVRPRKIDSAKRVTSILLIIGIAMLILSTYFFTRLDHIVLGDLYSYGLQFSNEWYGQYLTYSRLMLTFLAAATGVSGASFVLLFISAPTSETALVRRS